MDDDEELKQLRAKRLAELQAQHGGGQSGSDQRQAAQQREQREQQEEEMRNNILSQILTQEARARLNIVKAAKPEKAKMVEDILISNARMGRLGGQLDEDALKDILERVSAQTKSGPKVNMQRRALDLDDDDDDL